MAEREFRRIQQAEERFPRSARPRERRTVSEASDSQRRKLEVGGARPTYLSCCESMQRVHIDPSLGDLRLEKATRGDVEDLAAVMLGKGLSPQTVRNVLSYLHSVFEHAIDLGWTSENQVRRAARPKRRRAGDVNPDLQFLTLLRQTFQKMLGRTGSTVASRAASKSFLAPVRHRTSMRRSSRRKPRIAARPRPPLPVGRLLTCAADLSNTYWYYTWYR